MRGIARSYLFVPGNRPDRFAKALASTDGLQRVIARHLDPGVTSALADLHRRGRRCWIGTTDLDSMLPVYWNLGEIAAAADPGSIDLVRSLLLASASIPGAFPPVRIGVEAEGQAFDELHVDGGASSQVFAYPLEFNMRALIDALGFAPGSAKLYLIRNARLTPRREEVRPGLFPVIGRAVSSLIRTQGLGDLHRIYAGAVRDGIEFHAAHIPDDFTARPSESFDLGYMRELYETGRSMARNGYRWLKAPPDLASPSP